MAPYHLPDISAVTTVDLARILEKDDSETAKLFAATKYPGYFYLAFRNAPQTRDIVEQGHEIVSIADDYFQQPEQVKAKDMRRTQPKWSDRGYKYCDTDESFEISTDEMRAGDLELPAALDAHAALLTRFQSSCHVATKAVLSRLADTLNLPQLMAHHGDDKPSESGLKLIAEPSIPHAAEVIENKHRDSGSLTMLFYDTWSLQVCLSDDDDGQGNWTFVPPPPEGCALVHGASSLARLSGGRLRSPLHRVTQPSDGAGKRYFLSYFLRPEHRLSEIWARAEVAGAAS